MSTNTSLKKSLSIGLTLGVSLLWLFGAITSGLVVQKEMNESFDKALKKSAQHILPLVITDSFKQQNNDKLGIPTLENDDEYLTYVVKDQQGNVLLRSKDANPQIFGEDLKIGFSNTSTHRIYTTSALEHHVYIAVAEPLEHREEDLMEAAIALLLPLLFLAPISLLGIWWIIRLSLRKVVIFQHAIEERGAGNLSPVEMEKLPKEFKPIAVAVNRLLERLRRTLEAERSFTANSAHELRTPLATALAKVQRIKSITQDEQLKRQIADVESSLKSLSKQSEKLLELAKAEGGGAISQQPHNLVPILKMIVGDFSRQTPERIKLTLPTGDINSLLDPDAFAILARNLIENALKHGRPNRPVDVSLQADGTLRVVNECDLVAPQDLVLLRNRFVRANTTAPGSGLGLAIVDAIAKGAELTLQLRSPASGKQDGFEVELNLGISISKPC
ncbi:two-component sensor histidine kinase [Marinomonas sp. UCMA 3892]|uniref:sensor histidine kinase n=1 Tax=Marinomonas sp. UCMA 3892 TaxID=1972585 RepID=UPI00146EF020|nr:ATP-binding protein [Marinomonas sp. UCMA 3892]NLU97604.1 two-component sensor histidine kinase [Marinomonas sp. UCMA 3892]